MKKVKYYSGRFRPSNPSKYTGNIRNIQYRSLWERQVFRWCDTNSSVKSWSSEEIAIPYLDKTDNKSHIYYPDLKITFEDGRVLIIEIKPKNQVEKPKKQSRMTKGYIQTVLLYVKNISKWAAAEAWCKRYGYEFTIWTEDTLKNLGIKLLTG